MAIATRTIDNPVTGEHITILESTEETNGERLSFDCRVEPGKTALPPHVHENQEERFEIISGELGVLLGKDRLVLEAGERVILPPGIKHQWWNAGDGDVRFRVEAAPAGNLEAVLEAVGGMARAGKLNKKAMPRNPFLLANLGRLSETYLPGIPIWMQKPALEVGSIIGRIFGVDPAFSAYRRTGPEVAAPIQLEEAA